MVVAAMDPEIKADIEKTVLEILEDADMAEMTEYKARKLAGNKLGMNLSEPHYKKFIRSIIENFLKSREEAQAEEEQAKEEVEAEAAKEEEEEEEEEEEKRPRKQSKKAGTVRQSKQAELQQTSKDDIGDLIICWLSGRRNVTVQDFRGKRLISIREYYERDGKQLPSSKGISLTIDQWESFKKAVPAIEEAIEQLQ